MRVYSPADNGLGDRWAAINWCLRCSISCGERVLLSGQPVDDWHREKFRPARLQTILSPLHSAGGIVEIVHWRVLYLPTKKRWQPNRGRRICYQTDPLTLALNYMGEMEERAFIEGCRERGYEPFRLHGGILLEQCVHILAESAALVGTSSGFSRMAHSIGTPLFLVQGEVDLGYLIKHHVGKSYVLCRSHQDFFERLELERACGLFSPGSQTNS